MIQFISFTSGSCGNCSLLRIVPEDGSEPFGLMIDAGSSLRNVSRCLYSVGLSPQDISAVVITHDHFDHIRSLGTYCKKLHLPVYTTATLHGVLSRHSFTENMMPQCRRLLSGGEWNTIHDGVEIRYFLVPHDATETVGYAIRTEGRMFVLMTDLGSVPEEAMALAKEADTVVVESNFDVDMLLGGSYPHELKMRIFKGFGHLSNDACADAIREFWHPGLKNLFLCHLSGNNNTPELALKSAGEALKGLGVKKGTINLRVLPRGQMTPLLNL